MKNIIKRLLIVIAFLAIAIMMFCKAPEYDLEYKYRDGDIRVIFNDTEITRNINKLPEAAMLINDEIMLSQNTIDILFDKNLYYEEKYETLITTTKQHRANIEINSKTIEIDEKTKNLAVPAIKVNYDYQEDSRYLDSNNEKRNLTEKIVYIPIKALEEVYDITVEFKEKIIITENNTNRIRVLVDKGDNIELKHAKDSFSKNVEVINEGSYIDIFDFDATKEYIYARSENGEIGYLLADELKNYNLEPITVVNEEKMPENINVVWDYIHPNATMIGTKSERKKAEPIDVVAPTLLYLKNTKGDIKYNSNVVSEYLEWAYNVGYRVWVTFKNDEFDISETSNFLNDMVHRNNAIQNLIEFAKKYKIEGLNVDIEWIYQKDATAFSQFVRELVVKAKQNDITISVCVNVPDGSADWSLCYQQKALSEYADYLAVMAYDQYGAFSKIAGPNASLDWVKTNVEKLVQREKILSQKIILGIPLYSRLWSSNDSKIKSTTLTMKGAKAYLNKEDKAVWSEEDGQYFYENKNGTTRLWIEENESIKKKLELVEEYNLGGTAYWMLGYETEDIWETISDFFKK